MLDEFEVCKESYYREFDRKDSLTSALSLPIGICTVISSGFLYVANTIETVDSRVELVVVVAIFFGGLSIFCAIYYVANSYIGYAYQYVPTQFELRNHIVELREYYDPDPESESKSKAEALEYLIEKLALTAHNNSGNNDVKSGHLHRANLSLIVGLFCLLFAAIPVTVMQFNLNLTNIKNIYQSEMMPNSEKGDKRAELPKQKPNPPPVRETKESDEYKPRPKATTDKRIERP